jgi:hypothetical protein
MKSKVTLMLLLSSIHIFWQKFSTEEVVIIDELNTILSDDNANDTSKAKSYVQLAGFVLSV